MPEEQPVKFNRQQLYNEIWAISVTGVAKKYNLPYAVLIKSCKTAEIPVPASGYWTQLRVGKPVKQTPLPDSIISEVTIPIGPVRKRTKNTVDVVDTEKIIEIQQDVDNGIKTNAELSGDVIEKEFSVLNQTYQT